MELHHRCSHDLVGNGLANLFAQNRADDVDVLQRVNDKVTVFEALAQACLLIGQLLLLEHFPQEFLQVHRQTDWDVR